MQLSPNLFTQLYYHVLKRCTPDWELHFGKIAFNDLTFVLEGQAIFSIDGVDYHVSKGDAVFIPTNSTRKAHTFHHSPLVCAAFSFHILEQSCPLILPPYFHWEHNPKLKGYFNELNFEWLHKKPHYEIKCHALFHLILFELLNLENTPPDNHHVDQIKHYIITHLSEKLSVTHIADTFNLHPAYCGALFKKHTGLTLLQYINLMRINQAKELLVHNDMSIHQIGCSVGLEDPYYFSKLFKSLVGISPLTYRNTHLLLPL